MTPTRRTDNGARSRNQKRRSNIGARSRNARRLANIRASESEHQRIQRRETNKVRTANARAMRSQQERADDMETNRVVIARRRAIIDQSQRNLNERVARRRREAASNLNREAFHYDETIDYSSLQCVNIGTLSNICQHCNAVKFPKEPPGLCCVNGKVRLPALAAPPEPLRTLLSGVGQESNHFLANIQKYNNCFQMTSFGASHIVHDNFMPTVKVISHQTS